MHTARVGTTTILAHSAPAPPNHTQPRAATAEPASASMVISLLTWEAADLTIECLRSIEPEINSVTNLHVIVVDNGSEDGSDDEVEQAINEHKWADWVTFVRAPGNYGFAAGNNLAIRQALAGECSADYVLLLNPDTVVRPNAFRILFEFMEKNPTIGIAGGCSEDPDGTPQVCCFRFPNPISEFLDNINFGLFDRLFERFLTKVPTPTEPQPIGWVSGALMIVRKTVFEDIGLMDEGYFLYYEETDFIIRANRAGWPCWHIPSSRIVHYVGHSANAVTKRNTKPTRRPAFWFESRHRFFLKNHGLLYTALTDLCAIAGLGIWQVRSFLERKENTKPPYYLTDQIRHSIFVRGRRLNTPEQARASLQAK